ncbi:MAG: DMT family transporter [Gemmatimonadetes bacterium]|nr:DMT family transporter [Gemmatimonadota bacterium]MBK9549325.1 DMT family transporter [Gemmatimonadota bacterium]MBP6570180.1 DMT family transporter [Gemmatimonadales bacterium]MBP7620758.1 DMT family transporter [Gemmatimonadales bacterium]MBP9897510.1 DMT family transporter [Gemmatimonadales bacterium]
MSLGVILALVMVQVLFASLAITGKFVLPFVPAFALVAFRLAGGAIVFDLVRRRQTAVVIPSGDRWRLIGLGLLGLALNQTLFLFGLRHSTAINATILVATIPVLTAIIGVVTGRERPAPLKLAGMAIAIAGTVWLIGPDRIAFDHDTALGNLAIEVGMVAYALYLVYSRALVRRHGSIPSVALIFTSAAIGYFPIGAWALWHLDWTTVPVSAWWWTLWIVLGPTVGTYFLNLWALKRTSSNVVAGFVYLQPMLTAVVAPLVLAGEQLTPRAIGAGLAIFVGLGCILRAEQVALEASAAGAES